MCILERKPGQYFIVTGPTKIEVVGINENGVILKIHCREEVQIMESPLHEARRLLDMVENQKGECND